MRALTQVAERGGLFLLICHAFVTGVDGARLAVLGDLLRAATSDARLSVHTAGEIAAMLLTH